MKITLHMVTSSSVDVGDVDQAVPYFPKMFFYAGQGLSGKDVVMWADWER